jgi:hypothetical protein
MRDTLADIGLAKCKILSGISKEALLRRYPQDSDCLESTRDRNILVYQMTMEVTVAETGVPEMAAGMAIMAPQRLDSHSPRGSQRQRGRSHFCIRNRLDDICVDICNIDRDTLYQQCIGGTS